MDFTKDEKRNMKKTAEAILNAKKQNYDDWLAENHFKLILDNSELISKSIGTQVQAPSANIKPERNEQ